MIRGVTRIVDDKVISTYRKGCQWNRRSPVDQSTAPAGAPNHLIRNNVTIGDADRTRTGAYVDCDIRLAECERAGIGKRHVCGL